MLKREPYRYELIELKRMALLLPDSFHESTKKCIMMGKQILADKEMMVMYQGQTIDPGTVYHVKKKVLYKTDHLTKLKSAFKIGGMSKAIEYFDEIGTLNRSASEPINLHSSIL